MTNLSRIERHCMPDVALFALGVVVGFVAAGILLVAWQHDLMQGGPRG